MAGVEGVEGGGEGGELTRRLLADAIKRDLKDIVATTLTLTNHARNLSVREQHAVQALAVRTRINASTPSSSVSSAAAAAVAAAASVDSSVSAVVMSVEASDAVRRHTRELREVDGAEEALYALAMCVRRRGWTSALPVEQMREVFSYIYDPDYEYPHEGDDEYDDTSDIDDDVDVSDDEEEEEEEKEDVLVGEGVGGGVKKGQGRLLNADTFDHILDGLACEMRFGGDQITPAARSCMRDAVETQIFKTLDESPQGVDEFFNGDGDGDAAGEAGASPSSPLERSGVVARLKRAFDEVSDDYRR